MGRCTTHSPKIWWMMLASFRILLSQNQPQNWPQTLHLNKPAKGDAQGKKNKNVQQFTMRYTLTKKGSISEPVDL